MFESEQNKIDENPSKGKPNQSSGQDNNIKSHHTTDGRTYLEDIDRTALAPPESMEENGTRVRVSYREEKALST